MILEVLAFNPWRFPYVMIMKASDLQMKHNLKSIQDIVLPCVADVHIP